MNNAFISEENQRLQQRYIDLMHAMWMVNTTGKKEWQEISAKNELKDRMYFADSQRFAQFSEHLQHTATGSPDHRCCQRFYQMCLENQIPSSLLDEMVTLSTTLENRFTTFRGQVDGNEVTENEIQETLRQSDDADLCRKMWLANKQVGSAVVDDLIALVKLRNQAAHLLGYQDYYQMSFQLQELDLADTYKIFDELKVLTDQPFAEIKAEMDHEIAQHFAINHADIRPWHYADPFFQQAPAVADVDLDALLGNQDIEKLTLETFTLFNLPIYDLLKNSDLYERTGKNQSAFCQDMDRSGDIRVLCNIKSNKYWMDTMLHEFGHAVYDKYIDQELPFILRTPAHILMTEAVAMFFGRMTSDPEWLQLFLKITGKELENISGSLKKLLRRQMLMTARWVLTFVAFERELYANPDQDLNRLWWKLVQEIQLVTPPDEQNRPDWAAKIHFTVAPVYYHNYLFGELVASQFHHHIINNVSPSLFSPATGRFFIERVFQHGDRYHWQELLRRAVGERLNPVYFVNQFVYN